MSSTPKLEEASDLLQKEFKLSSYEARVYLALLQARMKPKELATKARVPLPRVYDTLDRLEQKGFVHQADERYAAMPPEQALLGRIAHFEQETRRGREQLEHSRKRLLALLKPRRGAEELEHSVVMLRGITGITNKLLEILENAREVYLTAKKGMEAKEYFLQYADKLPIGRAKIRILIPAEARLDREELELAKRLRLEIRRSSGILFDVVVVDGRDVIIGVPDPMSEELFHSLAVWIRSEGFARSVRESFVEMWDKSKPF